MDTPITLELCDSDDYSLEYGNTPSGLLVQNTLSHKNASLYKQKRSLL